MSNQPKKIMGWESSGMVKFNLWPLLQGLTRIAILKHACINSFIIAPKGMRCETS